jgi:hypothetical protein
MDARALFWSALICWTLAGCGGGGAPSHGEDPPEPETFEPLPLKEVNSEKLPKLSDYLPRIDPKVEVAPPRGWIPRARSKDYLVAFVRDKSAAVPAIVVKTADSAVGEIADVTADNVIDYAKAIQATLNEPIESARPMRIGEHYFARYVKEARVADLPAEVQVLTTVREGRTYTIELRIRDVEDLQKYKNQAYAVAAGLNFAADDRPFEFKLPAEATETKPAETPPPAPETKPAVTPPPATK